MVLSHLEQRVANLQGFGKTIRKPTRAKSRENERDPLTMVASLDRDVDIDRDLPARAEIQWLP